MIQHSINEINTSFLFWSSLPHLCARVYDERTSGQGMMEKHVHHPNSICHDAAHKKRRRKGSCSQKVFSLRAVSNSLKQELNYT